MYLKKNTLKKNNYYIFKHPYMISVLRQKQQI